MPSRGYYLTGDGYERYQNKQPDIKLIQEFLNWAIDAHLEVDGFYGDMTTQAVAQFQQKVGIEVDGSYGKDTLKAAKAFRKNEPIPIPSQKEVKASQDAKSYSASIAGTYIVNSRTGLNVRDGAGTSFKVLVAIPLGKKVENYGYYTDAQGIRWLYIAFEQSGVKYIGFASSEWLSR